MRSATTLDLATLDTSTPHAVTARLAAAAATVAVPHAAPADSFVLHAPLELMARIGLLPLAHEHRRDEALAAIEGLASAYAATGPAVDPPPPAEFPSLDAAASAADAAIRAGDAAAADAAVSWVFERADHRAVRRLLAGSIVDSLAAAGHASIAFHLLPRVAGGSMPAALLRGAVRTIAGQPAWRLDWFRDAESIRDGRSPADPARDPDEDPAPDLASDLAAALASVPHLGRPGSDFIFPLMSQAQRSGVAAGVLGPVLAGRPDVASAGRVLLRAAAWSMLHDDPSQAPYGWTHCLTMPQAVLSLAGDGVDPEVALAVAATYVVGFRAAHGVATLPAEALADEAAGTSGPASAGMPDVAELATFAALHHDTHLVKYTLACVHAAAADPAWAPAYLRAASHLADWWRAHPDGP